MSGSQSTFDSERGSSIRRARMAPTARSSTWPNAFTRIRPARSMTTRLGVPRSWKPAHRDGQGDPGVVSVHADRERYAVFVQERFE